MKRGMLFVSELGALVGRNKYQPAPEAQAKVWRRLDPRSFQMAERRAEAHVWMDEELVQAFEVDVTQAVAADTEAEATETAMQLLEQSLLRVTPGMVRTLKAARQESAAKVHEVVRTLIPDSSLATRVADSVVEAKNTKSLTAALQLPKVKDCASVSKSVLGVVNKSRGTRNEDAGIKLYERKFGTNVSGRNDTFYKCNVGCDEFPCWIGGRVDGLTADSVVEVKCRRNRLFRYLPAYEKVQIHAYMHLTGRRQCELVQKHDGDSQTKTHAFDKEYWTQLVEDILQAWDEIQELLRDTRVQDDLIAQLNH